MRPIGIIGLIGPILPIRPILLSLLSFFFPPRGIAFASPEQRRIYLTVEKVK